MAVVPVDPIWVDTTQELNLLCQRWQQQAAIALDTEFMRTSTYYPIAALFQVGDGQGCYLIDPLAIDDFSAFKALLINPAVTKVLHSSSEDLEVFQHFLQLVPKPLVDTQLAAAVAGLGFSLGYARLVESLLTIPVAKSETRSDWLARPLSQSQLQYAALDVAYLMVVYGLLLQRLKALDRVSWVEEDCARIVSQAEADTPSDQLYLKVKSAWKLNHQQLAVLQDLVAWREEEARQRNVPRNRLVKERALFDMARLLPTEIRQLNGLEGMTPRSIKMDGDVLLTIIAKSRQRPLEQCPQLLPAPLSTEQVNKLKQLREAVRGLADEIQIAPEVLIKKKEFEGLIRESKADSSYNPNSLLTGWRQQVLSQTLIDVVQSW